VVIPQFPLYLAGQCGAGDHSRNADILWAAMEQERAINTIDTLRIGLAGHSAGGLSAFLAASRHEVNSVLLFDAVDNGGLGAAQVANVSGPVMFLATEPSTCNSQNNSLPWFADVSGLKGKLKVVGSSHCEPQDPLSSICAIGCSGTTQQARQDLFKKYALAFFDRFLNDVVASCLDTIAQADAQAGTVANVDFQFGGCGAVADAGSSVDAGADVDAGSVSDAGSALDAGANENDAGVTTDAGTMQPADGGSDGNTPTPAGCGCNSAGAWAVLASLAVLLLRRRS
jgi:pimeloyl-ACP methyl ester carboxylesterase